MSIAAPEAPTQVPASEKAEQPTPRTKRGGPWLTKPLVHALLWAKDRPGIVGAAIGAAAATVGIIQGARTGSSPRQSKLTIL